MAMSSRASIRTASPTVKASMSGRTVPTTRAISSKAYGRVMASGTRAHIDSTRVSSNRTTSTARAYNITKTAASYRGSSIMVI